MAVKKDMYDQFLVMSVTMSAADTLTFGEINLGVSIFDYAAFVISRIEYKLARASFASLVANADSVAMAVTGSNSITDLGLQRPEVYDQAGYVVGVSGTPATAQIMEQPIIHDFSMMEGGGLIVPAQNIYLGMETTGFASAGSCNARVFFRVKELQAGDFIELVQRLRVLST